MTTTHLREETCIPITDIPNIIMLLIPAIDDELVCRILHNTWPAVDLSFLEFFVRTLRLLSRDQFAIWSESIVHGDGHELPVLGYVLLLWSEIIFERGDVAAVVNHER